MGDITLVQCSCWSEVKQKDSCTFQSRRKQTSQTTSSARLAGKSENCQLKADLGRKLKLKFPQDIIDTSLGIDIFHKII